MIRRLSSLLAVAILIAIPVVALAQAASLPTGDFDLAAFMVARFKDGSAQLAIAALAKLLTDLLDKLLLKPGALLASKVSRDVLRYFAIGSAGVGAFGGSLALGQGWLTAAASGLLAGLGAVGIDQAVKAPKPAQA